MSASLDTGFGLDHDIQVGTKCPPAEDQSSDRQDPASELFDRAAAEIPADFKYPFLTPTRLRNKLRKMQDQQENTTVRLLVTGVDEEGVEAATRTLPFRRSVRVWYESDVDSAIIKFMPSAMHEITASLFCTAVTSTTAQLPGHNYRSLIPVGATKFSCPGKRSKEGDEGLRCRTRTGAAAWPNLMFEVGYSESIRQLRLDAQWWLFASGRRTRMVILIKARDRPANALHLEVWRFLPNPDAQRTRRAPSHLPTITQTIDIDAAGVVAPAGALTLPYADLFDVANINAADVVFSSAELSTLALEIFVQSA